MILLEAGLGRVTYLRFQEDGLALYAHEQRSGKVRVWQGSQCERLHPNPFEEYTFNQVLIQGPPLQFIGITREGVLHRLVNGNMESLPLSGPVGTSSTLTFDPKTNLLCVAGKAIWKQAVIRRFDLNQLHERSLIRSSENRIVALHFSDDGNTLISASRQGMVRFWNPQFDSAEEDKNKLTLDWIVQTFFWMPTKQSQQAEIPFNDMIRDMILTPDDAYLAVALPRQVSLWRLGPDKRPESPHGDLMEPISTVNCLAASPDGQYLATGSRDGSVQIWDIASARLLRTYTWPQGAITSLAYAPDGLRLACGTSRGFVVVFDCD
ncbi:hypothetical protein KIH39_19810 [Telmatocola sphagniphila]|uniref:WD40 repeat domain-containing protein n=1 Tax=Telmatocola sphagniphila TaxID=1123043 RepID=A0A8E6B4C7_9BACT|nr:hypothetical protein [Telmatocola sphagniphila]QVL31074.1 hypothetical protein KIH39_19810 [Telmatocola sphagniphila]